MTARLFGSRLGLDVASCDHGFRVLAWANRRYSSYRVHVTKPWLSGFLGKEK